MNILVTVGTHEQPFQRLIDAVEQLIEETGRRFSWRIQYGTAKFSGRDGIESVPYYTSPQMVEAYIWADALVSQASPGTIFSSLDAATWPVVLGRQKKYAEHVDDHQLEFAKLAEQNGWATNLCHADPSSLGRVLAEVLSSPDLNVERCRRAAARFAENSRRFRGEVWDVLDSLA